MFYIVWLWVGVIFAILYWGMDIVTAITFAFFAMSTAGLQPPGDTSSVGLLFTTFYVAVGVPAFAVLCSYAIQIFRRIYIRNENKVKELMRTKEDFQRRRDQFATMKVQEEKGKKLSDLVREFCEEGDFEDKGSSDSDSDSNEDIIVSKIGVMKEGIV